MARQSSKSETSNADEGPARNGRPAAMAQDSAALLATAFARKGFPDPALVLRWAAIAGPEVARLAVPVKLADGPDGGVLTLKADPAAALFLAHETRTLTDRINSWAGRRLVAKLRLVQSPLVSRPVPSPPPRPHGVGPADPAQAFRGREGIKEALLSLARWRTRD